MASIAHVMKDIGADGFARASRTVFIVMFMVDRYESSLIEKNV